MCRFDDWGAGFPTRYRGNRCLYTINQSIAQPLSIEIPSTMDAIYPDGQMSISPSVALSDLQTPSRKRKSSEDVVYKVVDRRQKRMIKNRESAAHSRGLHE